MLATPTKYDILRARFLEDYKQGVKPVDSRKPIPDELASNMVANLVAAGFSKDAKIAVIDAYMILTTHLVENGFTNITILENNYTNLTSLQEKYYNMIESICTKQGFTHYVPPMNNWKRCDSKFDVIIGNPPYQNGKHKSTTNSLWKEFLEFASNIAETTYLVLPDIALAPPTFSKYKNNIIQVNLDVKKYFPGVGSGFCSLLLSKDGGEMTTIKTADDTIRVPVGSLDCVPLSFNQELLNDMQNYLSGDRQWNLTYEYESRKQIFCEDGQYEVLHTSSNGIRRTNVHHPNNDLIRVSVDVSGNPKFHLIQNMGLTQSHYWTAFETVDEAAAYVEWGNSDQVQSFLKKVKWGGMNSALIIKQLG